MTQYQQLQERAETISALNKVWSIFLAGSQVPTSIQFDKWLDLHTPETMMQAIKATAKKREKLNGEMSLEYMVRYCSSVANNAKRRARGIPFEESTA